MFIKNKRKAKYIGVLAVTTVLTCTSCKKEEQQVKLITETIEENQETEIITVINQAMKPCVDIVKEMQDIKKNPESYIEELTFSEDIHIHYRDSFNSLWIYPKREIEKTKEVEEEFYPKINLLIKVLDIKEIYIEDLEEQIDFSKIDFSNIRELSFDHFNGTFDSTQVNVSSIVELSFRNCNGKFNYSGFPKQLDRLYLSNTSLEMTAEIFSACDVKYFDWSETIENIGNLKGLLEYFIENDIHIETFSLNQWNKKDYNGITKEEFNLLGKINTSYIYIYADGFKEPLNLDITLNETISSFHIDAYSAYRDENYNIVNGELGNIKIKSDNEKLNLDFSYADITENTHFSIPDTSWINLGQLNCTDISAFKDLENVTYLWFKEDNGPGPEGEIRYCSDPSVEFYDAFSFNKKIDIYRNYDNLLKDVEYFFKLKELKARLEVSPNEYYNYYCEASIGDYATLINDDVEVYKSLEDLSNKQNPLSCYFGTSEDRCIRSICLKNGENKVDVNNMKDYECYLNEGYEVIGYSYINLYATGPDDLEFFVKDEDVKLILTPFK